MTRSAHAPVIVHVFGRTDVGRTREHNEDAFVVADLTRGNATLQPEVRTHEVGDRGTLFMVADGMGGAAAGEIASAMAIEVVLNELSDALSTADAPDTETYATILKRATAAANTHIHNYALEHPEFRGMGTTATVACVLGDTIFLTQVGDSRAYLVRDGVAQQITKDQSLMQKLIEAGEITEEEAELSERRNIILQALGPESNIKVDLTFQKIRLGDVLVLCSDGLSGQVRTEEIARAVVEETDLMAVCKRLIDRANENGGPDNITVIAARFDGEGLSAPASGDDVGHRAYLLPSDSGQVDAIPMPRAASWASTPTGAMDAVRRTTAKLAPEDYHLAGILPTPVSATRRTRGSLIALGFLVVLLGLATWFAYDTVSTLAAKRQGALTPSVAKP
jgi:protein phosphatase